MRGLTFSKLATARFAVALCATLFLSGLTTQYSPLRAADPPALKVLFLGDRAHHRPSDRFQQLQPLLAKRGIEVTYTERMQDLNAKTLADYDALLLYANIERIEPEQEQALLDYVESGKGFVPVHCASYCFQNSPRCIALIGAQFQKHGTGVVRATPSIESHPILKGFGGFASWDETYVHTKHNEKDRTVIEYRVEGKQREPWTWVRTQGKGRVFYTAWGHDQRTWGHPGFQNLLERGIRWAAGGEPGVVPDFVDEDAFEVPAMTARRTDVQPFTYTKAKLPNYLAGEKWGAQGAPLDRMQEPVAPAESIKHLVTPVGFHAELFAAEPQIGKPICMAWDERGRLWLAETVDYPNDMQPEGEGHDRIRICEDTDHDGRADKFTVFAEKLSIPTSLTFARGGVIVHQAPDTLFLRDTDGDDRADVREVLLHGWGTTDTHAGPNNLQYGFDNWIWGMVGYAGFNGTVGGEQHKFSQGFYRFRPDGSKLEFLRSTNNNTWGIGFAEDGLVFGSTANRVPSCYLPIANRYYESVRGWSAATLGGIADTYMFQAITDKVRQVDHHGGYTSAAGHALYTARAYPQEYWNRTAFVTEPTGHIVGTFVLSRDGADFHSTNPFNLLASDDEWTAPIMAEVGPDGHVWVIDWYNYIVQHNPRPQGFEMGKGNAYVTELRDKQHGRIYRVVYDAAPKTRPVTLRDAGPEQLVATLKDSNLLWRRQAQRLLVERGKTDVVPALVKLVGDDSVDALGLNVGAIHALWTLHGLHALEGSSGPGSADALTAALGALSHKSAGVRRNALLVLPAGPGTTSAIIQGGALQDTDAQVRLAAFLALADQPAHDAAGAALVQALQAPRVLEDHWLPDAATSAAARHAVPFLNAVSRVPEASGKLLAIVAIVAEHLARGSERGRVLAVLPSLIDAPPTTGAAVVAGLAKGWPKETPLEIDKATEPLLTGLLQRVPATSRGPLVKLAKAWGTRAFDTYTEEVLSGLWASVRDGKATDDARIEAARQLIQFRLTDDQVITQLLDEVTPRMSPATAVALVNAVGDSEAPGLGSALTSRLAGFTPPARSTAIKVLLTRPTAISALLEALEKGNVQLGELSLDQKQILASTRDPDSAKRARELLQRGGGLPNADRQKVLDELLPLAQRTGDVQRGKAVYKQNCAKCHVHSGEGGQVGPDLTGMAVHPKSELLINIIDPNRSVEGNFRLYTVALSDGRTLSGLLAGETKTSIELLDAEPKRHAILREDIDELVASSKSLMPEGFEKQIPADGLVDLLEFLAHRGKFLPLNVAKVATVVSTLGMFYSEDSPAERLIFADWSPKSFEGVPFQLVDPQGERIKNAILLYGPSGKLPPTMPKSVRLPCNSSAKAIHLLSGICGWGFPASAKGTLTMTVRLHYADGKTEDHPLRNGEHFADYIRRVDVPASKFAFAVRGQQVRYLAVQPQRNEVIREVEFVKGDDATAPVIMAVTVETP